MKALEKMNEGRAAEQKFRFFPFTSDNLAAADNPISFDRLLIVVPGDFEKGESEKWIQVAYSADKNGATGQISVLGVMRNEDGSHSTYFNDFMRHKNFKTGRFDLKRRVDGGALEACYTCHTQGIAHIAPKKGSVKARRADLDWVNQRLRTYKRPNFGRDKNGVPFFDPTVFWDRVGVLPENLTGEYAPTIRQLFKTDRKDAMKSFLSLAQCQGCHNGGMAQPIATPFMNNKNRLDGQLTQALRKHNEDYYKGALNAQELRGLEKLLIEDHNSKKTNFGAMTGANVEALLKGPPQKAKPLNCNEAIVTILAATKKK